jgi:predicted small integral membrane protein
MLSVLKEFQDALGKFLDTFFHLPTLIIIALIAVTVVWRMYETSLNFGNGFIRLNTNRGDVSLYWQNGYCHLDW